MVADSDSDRESGYVVEPCGPPLRSVSRSTGVTRRREAGECGEEVGDDPTGDTRSPSDSGFNGKSVEGAVDAREQGRGW